MRHNTETVQNFRYMVHTEDIESIKRRIVELQVEHRDLDQITDMLTSQPGFDQLQIRRLKKRKLQVKDSITLLLIQLEPDIKA